MLPLCYPAWPRRPLLALRRRGYVAQWGSSRLCSGGPEPFAGLAGFHLLIISPKTTRVLRDCLGTGRDPLPFLWEPHLPRVPPPRPHCKGGRVGWRRVTLTAKSRDGQSPPWSHGPPLCSQDVLLAKSLTEGPGRGSGLQHLPPPRRLRAPWVPAPPTDALPHAVCAVRVHWVHPISCPLPTLLLPGAWPQGLPLLGRGLPPPPAAQRSPRTSP